MEDRIIRKQESDELTTRQLRIRQLNNLFNKQNLYV